MQLICDIFNLYIILLILNFMKKTFILFICLAMTMGSFSQDSKKFSHWSMTLEGGLNKFDGDVKQKYNDILPNSVMGLSYGASLEYTVNPAWSMGLEYYYLPINATGPYYTVKNTMHNADFFMAVNLLKVFNQNSKTKWGLWATLGAGLAFYKLDYTTVYDNMMVPATSNSGFYGYEHNQHFTDGRAGVFPIGAILEYNVSKSLALGVKAQYRAFNKDNVDGRNFWGVTNDAVELGTLQLRWKINAHNKDHVRNINLAEYNGIVETPTIDVDALQNKMNALQNELDGSKDAMNKLRDGQPTKESIDELRNRIKELENRPLAPVAPVLKPEVATDTDGDGVPDNRDQEPNTPPNTAVDFWGRSIKGYNIDESGIYFDFDKSDIDAAGHKAIGMAADKLKANPSLVAEVRGFADYVGTPEYNMKLSQRRADKVKKELITKYNIDEKRIIANGKGRLLEPKTALRENRRCTFFYDK